MRNAFEAWAQRDGHIVRRREDKPDEYLVLETQRRWVIWQAALAYGKSAAAATAKMAAQKALAKGQAAPCPPLPDAVAPDQAMAMMRDRVLNEVLAAFNSLDGSVGMPGILNVIHGLKQQQPTALETEKPTS